MDFKTKFMTTILFLFFWGSNKHKVLEIYYTTQFWVQCSFTELVKLVFVQQFSEYFIGVHTRALVNVHSMYSESLVVTMPIAHLAKLVVTNSVMFYIKLGLS